MEKKVTGQKVKAFFKRNVYYVIMLVALLAIAALITVAVLTTRNKDQGIDGPSDPAVNVPNDGQDTPTPPVEDNPGSQQPVEPQKIVFCSPVNGGTLVKDYSMDMIVYSSTLKQFIVHDGIDLGGEEGAAVVAVYAGKVEKVSYDVLNGYSVVIDHGDGLKTVYTSLGEQPIVHEDDTVVKGQSIGVIGSSASAEMVDAPHVHFTVTQDGQVISPYDYMPLSWEK